LATEVNNFLISLAAAIASVASLQHAGTPRQLWTNQVNEKNSADPRTVLRIYGGPISLSMIRVPMISVQAETTGTEGGAVITQAWKVYEALLDSEGHPQSHWDLPGKITDATGAIIDDPDWDWNVKLVRFTNGPGIHSRDEQGRWICAFNFDVEFLAVSTA
jgi:hypothetical protein